MIVHFASVGKKVFKTRNHSTRWRNRWIAGIDQNMYQPVMDIKGQLVYWEYEKPSPKNVQGYNDHNDRKTSLDNTVYIHFLPSQLQGKFKYWLTQTHKHREDLWCVTAGWYFYFLTVKAWCSSGLHDTHDVTFLSLLLKYPTAHIFRTYRLYLMTFRWYKDSISRFFSLLRDPNETLAAIVLWRPTSKKRPVTYFGCWAIA